MTRGTGFRRLRDALREIFLPGTAAILLALTVALVVGRLTDSSLLAAATGLTTAALGGYRVLSLRSQRLYLKAAHAAHRKAARVDEKILAALTQQRAAVAATTPHSAGGVALAHENSAASVKEGSGVPAPPPPTETEGDSRAETPLYGRLAAPAPAEAPLGWANLPQFVGSAESGRDFLYVAAPGFTLPDECGEGTALIPGVGTAILAEARTRVVIIDREAFHVGAWSGAETAACTQLALEICEIANDARRAGAQVVLVDSPRVPDVNTRLLLSTADAVIPSASFDYRTDGAPQSSLIDALVALGAARFGKAAR